MTFDGFVPPTKNYFPMPNEWIDICSEIDNLAELKVIQYVLRHTWGYHEYGMPKAITVDEFMHGRKKADGSRIDKGTGLKSDRSVKDGLKAAIAHGYLIYEVDNTDKARIKKSYALNMRQVDTTPQYEENENRQVDTTPQTGRYYPSDSQNLPLGGANTTPRSEKDTNRNTPKKDTEERHGNGVNANASRAALADDVTKFFYENVAEEYEYTTPSGKIIAIRPDMEETQKYEKPVVKADQLDTGTSPTPDPAQRSGNVPAGSLASSGAVQRDKKPKQDVLKTPQELAMDDRCRALQQRINEWRGYELDTKGQRINESKSIRTLASRYTDERIEEIYLYLFNRHWKWSKPDNRYHIGAYVILSEAKSIEQELKSKPVTTTQQTPTPYVNHELNMRKLEQRKAEFAARRAVNG